MTDQTPPEPDTARSWTLPPLPDPAILWDSNRPVLQTLQHEARRRLKSPWALLSAALTLSLLSIPYPVRYRSALVPEGTPLNLAIALVGRSGAGKSTVFHGAAAALAFEGAEPPDSATARSGEGIPALLAHSIAERDTEPVLHWHKPDHAPGCTGMKSANSAHNPPAPAPPSSTPSNH